MLDYTRSQRVGEGAEAVVVRAGRHGVKAFPDADLERVAQLLAVQAFAAQVGVAPRVLSGPFRVRVRFDGRVRRAWAYRTELAELPWERERRPEPFPSRAEVRRLYRRVAQLFPKGYPDDHPGNYGRLPRLRRRLVLLDLGEAEIGLKSRRELAEK